MKRRVLTFLCHSMCAGTVGLLGRRVVRGGCDTTVVRVCRQELRCCRPSRTRIVGGVRGRRLHRRVFKTVGRLPSGYGRIFGLDCLRSVGGGRVTSALNVSLHAMRTRVCGTLGFLHRHLDRLLLSLVVFSTGLLDIFAD